MEAFVCDAVRTPIGRYGGALSTIRPDDLAARVIEGLIERNASVDWSRVDDVIFGAANQAGEDNRNVARMASLLAGLPVEVAGVTVNRLCASGLDSVGMAARAIRSGDCDLVIAGGVESMSRAPFVMPKAETPFARRAELYDTTIGWRFVNRRIEQRFGVETMPQTADTIAAEFAISRADQDAFAARSQTRWAEAHASGVFREEIVTVAVPRQGQKPLLIDTDEHPRPGIAVEKLARLSGINGANLTVTPGNASGVNDGAAALLIVGGTALAEYSLTPLARIVGMASAGVPPRIMGIGPVPATRKVLARAGLTLDQMDVIELNEAFASQVLASMRLLGLPDEAAHVNPNGGAIAMGHPLGMSGSRLVLAAAHQLRRSGGRYGLCTMCVGVGQGTAMILERV